RVAGAGWGVGGAQAVAQEPASRLSRIDSARDQDRLCCAQQLKISKEIGFAFASAYKRRTTLAKMWQEERTTQRAAKDVLHKLPSAAAVQVILILISI